MTLKKVKAHLVDIDWPVKTVQNPCGEIPINKFNTAVLMEPKQITKLRLHGITVFDYSEELDMGEEYVDPDKCYYPWERLKNEQTT